MRQSVSWIAITISAWCAVPLTGTAQSSGSAPPTLIVVSVDGMRPDYITAADAHGAKVPHLRKMVAEGTSAEGVRGVIPTVTYPSHTTIVTGVSPARHGILNNAPFDPLRQNAGGWYWYAEDIRVPTMWDVARRAGRTTAAIQWPATVGAKSLTWNIPEIWHAGDRPDDYKLTRALTTPGLLDEIGSALATYPGGAAATIEADSIRGRYAEWLLEHKRPSALFLHINSLDQVEHETGPFTPDALACLERLDVAIGSLRAVAERETGGNVVFAVVSDHGFTSYDKALNLIPAFKTAGFISTNARGAIVDWQAMPWATSTSVAVIVKIPGDTALVRRVGALIRQIAADTANGVERVLDAKGLRAQGALPTAQFWVGLKPGWRAGAAFDGPVLSRVERGGGHGGAPDLIELRAAFLVVGRGVSAGKRLGVINMVDIAPTLGRLVGLTMPDVEGRDVLQ